MVNLAFAQSVPKFNPQSGLTFQSDDIRAMQTDAAQNPGMLWVDSGRVMFAKDCASCHAVSRVPALAFSRPRAIEERIENLADAVNVCVTQRLHRPALTPESQPMLSLTAYVMYAAQGQRAPAPAQPTREGAMLWYARQGKQDLSCALCHDGLVGKRVLNQTISQGHSVGYPAYRLEWQSVGSLERRIRACYFGMQAEVPAPGSSTLRALELYLAHRAAALPIETPAVRR
jgi:L-cysteine S-thiosulfotransferase